MRMEIEKFMPQVDNKELVGRRRKILLEALVTTGLANVAQYIAIAKVPDLHKYNNAVKNTNIKVDLLRNNGYNIIKLSILTETINSEQEKDISNDAVYVFRGISNQSFEPFVCISRYKKTNIYFAYADDENVLTDMADGTDYDIIKEIQKQSSDKDLKLLNRYVTLIERAINPYIEGGEKTSEGI